MRHVSIKKVYGVASYDASIIPTALFERRRKYNIPVYMSVHPELNQYIIDVLLGVKPVLDKGEVEKVILSIKSKV